jgi:exopolyphosphatase/guanosine-5'-triphosphate,3'-diphosphate pyrophosphatase
VSIRVAAIDCGTNSIRLLIADLLDDGRLVDVLREMKIVRLGEGVDRTGRLSEAALTRTFDALAEYVVRIRVQDADRVRMVATSASRDAQNSAEFVAGVRSLLGKAPEVITGEEEAALSFAGATADLLARPEFAPPYLVVDIGGGSTEFILGGDHESATDAVASRSVDIGCVRLAERHLTSDPASSEQLEAAQADARAAIAEAARAVDLSAARTLVAVAGTATTVTALSLGLPAYDPDRIHLSAIPLAEVERVYEELARMTAAERAALGPMHPGRVDVIVAGALILREVVRAAGTGFMVASEHDILDGIALSLAR